MLVLVSVNYEHFYVNVYKGTVIDLDQTSGPFGRITYQVHLKGRTLAGEEMTYWVSSIPWREWHKLKEGDPYSWSE